MATENVVDLAIERVADALPVDWMQLDREARTDEEREDLKYLRILGQIADLHRSAEFHEPIDGDEATRTVDKDSLTDDPARVWGRYRLLERVGEGSFGSVHRAWDPELQWEVAIKILHSNIADPRLKDKLKEEGRALARVQHQNVVRVLGIESHGDRVGLCMEFVQGETLEGALKNGTLDAREAALVGEDVCRALAAVHREGFVHRDVKARNVMRDRTGRIVLMDFGTGRHAEKLRTAGPLDIAGTPVYMAPEVLAGEGASALSDVYSVGVLLYHLVTAEYPVEGRTMSEVRAAHMQGRRRALNDRRPDLPLPFIEVIDRALAPDPAHRFPSAGALLESLAALHVEVQAKARWTVYLLATVRAAAAALVALTLIGYLTSRAFNLVLERSDFVSETVGDWFLWGAMSSVLPLVLFMLVLIAMALFLVVRRLVAFSSAGRRLDARVRNSARQLAHRLHLDDVTAAASWALLLSALLLASAWWYFLPLITSATTYISNAPVEDLTRLSPGAIDDQDQFRRVFSYVLIVSALASYYVRRLTAKASQPLGRSLVLGQALVVVLAFISLGLPYRLFIKASLETARWNELDCYILGERAQDGLLFCPTLAPPRNRIVPKSAFQRLGTTENIFTKFSTGRPE